MLRKLRPHLSFANVTSMLALFVALGGTSAVALSGTDTVFSDDIVNDQVASADVRNDSLSGGGLFAHDLAASSVRSSEVANGSLNDEDVAQATFVNFAVDVGTVVANGCNDIRLNGIDADAGDHLLLTPSEDDAGANLSYGIDWASTVDDPVPDLKVCNPSNFDVDDGTTHFNVLVIDAQ